MWLFVCVFVRLFCASTRVAFCVCQYLPYCVYTCGSLRVYMFVVLAFVRVLIFMCKSVAFCMYTCVVFHMMRVAFCVRACIAFYAYMRMWLLCIYAFSFCV